MPTRRRSIRLKEFDYSEPGAYFVTICAANHRSLFGEISGSEMQLNETGMIVKGEWLEIPSVRRDLELDAYAVMPNHFHGIVLFLGGPSHGGSFVGASQRFALKLPKKPTGTPAGSLGAVIAQFKSRVTKRVNVRFGCKGTTVWQRGFYEHVIRDRDSVERIRRYVVNNPVRWAFDRENLHRVREDEFDRWLATFKTRPDVGRERTLG